jgi:RNA-dependent RNA polymerase
LQSLEIDPQVFEEYLEQQCEASEFNEQLMVMVQSGIFPSEDVFLLSCVHRLRQHSLKLMTKKARIFVKDGAQLLGVSDPTGRLKEGQVFVQFRQPLVRNGETVYQPHKILGKVVLAKFPVSQAGDVQVCCAVDELARDVIVFSTQGSRPLSNMLSGPDLDGDLYWVSWDPSLLPSQITSPAEFDQEKPKAHPSPITRGMCASSLSIFSNSNAVVL